MGNLLENLRQAAGGITRHRLATEAGLHHDVVNKYESGKRDLSEEDLDKISKVIASRLQIAYVAGLFDRASSWSIAKILPNREKNTRINSEGKKYNTGPINHPVYSARIRFQTKHKLLAKVLENVFGVGFIYYRSNLNKWDFFAANRKAREVAETLLPYLVMKREQAQSIIDLVNILEKRPGRARKVVICHYVPNFKTTAYDTVKAASEALHIKEAAILQCLYGKQKTAKNGTLMFSHGEQQDNTSYLEECERLLNKIREV